MKNTETIEYKLTIRERIKVLISGRLFTGYSHGQDFYCRLGLADRLRILAGRISATVFNKT